MNQKTYTLTDFFIHKFNKKNKGEFPLLYLVNLIKINNISEYNFN